LGFADAERAPPDPASDPAPHADLADEDAAAVEPDAGGVPVDPVSPPAIAGTGLPRPLVGVAVVLSLIGVFAGVRLVLADQALSSSLAADGDAQLDDLFAARD